MGQSPWKRAVSRYYPVASWADLGISHTVVDATQHDVLQQHKASPGAPSPALPRLCHCWL